MDMKKNPFSLHVNVDDFIPATDAEKEYMVQMRPSTTFFKDGMKRLVKNHIAFASLIIIILITLASIVIPFFWPYKYDAMLGIRPGKPTGEYLAKICNRLTLFGAFFLMLIAIIPALLMSSFGLNSMFGPTSILIMVSVALETSEQLESMMLTRHYKGCLG